MSGVPRYLGRELPVIRSAGQVSAGIVESRQVSIRRIGGKSACFARMTVITRSTEPVRVYRGNGEAQ
jgi:hypothetical protein